MTEVIRITEDSTRAEIEEAIANVLASKRRLGKCAKPAMDDRINALLDDWRHAAGGPTCTTS